jgi:class 3 adenylate cyclase/tetratricopeptide (TPR) repeat protein
VTVCPKCGEENPPRARFCLACGTALDAEPARVERKIVSVLFADLVGFTSRSQRLDVEDVSAVLSPYHALLRRELERFGGTVEKFIGDAVMALFGAPVAHEDDAERAVRAALAVRLAIEDLNEQNPGLDLHVRIGVNSGEALIALGARPSEGEGMASGDVVNTCARLQSAAPIDGILVGEGTYRATQRSIEYRQAAAIDAKGKDEPVGAWEALQARASLGVDLGHVGSLPLVAREHELALLRGALARSVRERAPQFVTLVGVPGIGKSRLVWELGRIVDDEPDIYAWRQGRSLSYGDGVAFWALGEIVKAQAGVLESDDAEAAAQKLEQTVRDVLSDEREARWVESFLRPLVGLSRLAAPESEGQLEAFAAWSRFFEALAERRPLVLVFEDLHWADDALLDFVDELVDRVTEAPLLVVATGRPELLTRRTGWGGGKPNAFTVSLAALTDEESGHLLGALLDQPLLPADLRAALLTRCGGNPLYAEEYVRMLQERGVLRREAGGWQLAEGELPLPETVHGLIAARLDLLPVAEKQLLQDASVLGKVVWSGALCALSGSSQGDVEAHLQALARKEFVRRERRSSVVDEHQFGFRHLLVRDVAYAQIPRAERARKHRLAAEWIEALSPERSDEYAELRAHHYLTALELTEATRQPSQELGDRAREALSAAGDRALSLYSPAAALRLYEAALKLADTSDRPGLLLRLGRAHAHGEDRGEEALTDASLLLHRAGDFEGAAEAEVLLADLQQRAGEREGARARIDAAVELLADRPASRAKVAALSARANHAMLDGDSERAIAAGRSALAMIDELGLDDLRAWVLMSQSIARLDAGDADGLRQLDRAADEARARIGVMSGRVLINVASVKMELGELSAAYVLRDEARSITQRTGDARARRWLRMEHLTELFLRGRLADATGVADELLAEIEAGARSDTEAACRCVRARIRLLMGDRAGALSDAELAVSIGRMQGQQELHAALATGALVQLEARARGAALELLDEVLEAIGSSGQAHFGAEGWSAPAALTALDLGRGERLCAILECATVPSRWITAAMLCASGDTSAAADAYAEMGSAPDEASVRMLSSEQLLARGERERAQAECARALALARHIGAAALITRAEALVNARAS